MRSGSVSEWRVANRGCPQGSNLGPLLWIIFQNDLVQKIQEGRLAMNADDHQVYSATERTEDVTTMLNNEGTRTSEWYQQNLLKCNQEKFQAMSLGPRHAKKEMNLNLKNISRKCSSGIDLLGLAVDDKLDFTKHINNVRTKGAKKVGALMRFRTLIPTAAKFRIFKAIILWFVYVEVLLYSDTTKFGISRLKFCKWCVLTLKGAGSPRRYWGSAAEGRQQGPRRAARYPCAGLLGERTVCVL